MTDNLQQAIDAVQAGDKKRGQGLLSSIIQSNPRNELAWYWMVKAVEDPERKKECLGRVLAINPDNQQAARELLQLQQPAPTKKEEPPVQQPAKIPPKKKSGISSRGLAWIIIAGLLLVLLAVFSCITLAACRQSPTPSPDIPVEDVGTRTITADKGTFEVPGIAYIDGRDPNASPPLTIKSINIWKSPDRLSHPDPIKVTCRLEHGTQVDLLDAKLHSEESRYYFLLRSGSCEGWLPESFLSREYQEPIGDWF